MRENGKAHIVLLVRLSLVWPMIRLTDHMRNQTCTSQDGIRRAGRVLRGGAATFPFCFKLCDALGGRMVPSEVGLPPAHTV